MTIEQFLKIINARKWFLVITTFVFFIVGLAASFMMEKIYVAETIFAIDSKATDPITGQPMSAFMSPGYIATQLDVIRSQAAATKVVDSLKLTQMPDVQAQFNENNNGVGDIRIWLADRIRSGLNVIPSKESNTITLSYSATNPEFAATMANAFLRAYEEMLIAIKSESAMQSNLFLQEQLKVLRKNYEFARNELSKFQQDNDVIGGSERIDLEEKVLSELSSQLVAAQSSQIDAQSRVHSGQNTPEVMNSTLVVQIKSQLISIENKLEEISQKNGINHPKYKELQGLKRELEAQLLDETAKYYQGVKVSVANTVSRTSKLADEVEKQKQRVLKFKTLKGPMDVLNRNVLSAERAYDQALQRYSQTLLESKSTQANIVVLQKAIAPEKPSKPRKLINSIISAVFGLLIALPIVLMIENAMPKLRSRKNVDQLGLPILAEFHKHGAKKAPFLKRMKIKGFKKKTDYE